MDNGSFVKIQTDALVSYNGRPARVRRILSLESVVLHFLETDETERVSIDQLRSITEANTDRPKEVVPDLAGFTDEDWSTARRNYGVIEPLISNPFRTRTDVEKAASKAGVHTATVYEWIKAYTRTGHLSALVPMQRGRKKGDKKLEPDVEAIIQDVIEHKYLESQRLRPAAIIERVIERCRDLKLKPPHPNTIRNRLMEIPRHTALRARGFRDAANKLSKPLLGEFPNADHPLSVVQIDHTRLDIIVVHEESRTAWGRPWLTVAVDVYSRMVAGIYLSMDTPSAVAGGVCLSMAMLPKAEYLSSLGISGRWPVYGKIRLVHSDNGKDFKSLTLQRACEQYGIDFQLRPSKTPHYGGHIERYIGNINREMHKLPGTTFSKPHLREGYDSKKKASLTLRELEAHIVEWIVNQYHQRSHSAINMSPLRKWELAILGDGRTPGCGVPPIPPDPERLQIDFLPIEERTIQNYGVQIDLVTYYDEVFNRWINAPDLANPKEKRKFTFRVDPRHISKIWFFDPEAKQYFEIPYRNPSYPDVSRLEFQEAHRHLQQQGLKAIDEDMIFTSIKRNRERVEMAEAQTRSSKRNGQKKPAVPRDATDRSNLEKKPNFISKVAEEPDNEFDDLFSEPVSPLKNVRVGS